MYTLRRDLDMKKLSLAIRLCQEKNIFVDLPVLIQFSLRKDSSIADIEALKDGEWLSMKRICTERKSL